MEGVVVMAWNGVGGSDDVALHVGDGIASPLAKKIVDGGVTDFFYSGSPAPGSIGNRSH